MSISRTSRRLLSPGGALALALVLTAALTGCMSTRTAETQSDDAAITASVKSALAANGDVNPFNIDVDTNEGVVRLSGLVEKPEAREIAARIAADTEGVVRVQNDIRIGDRTAGESIDDGLITTKIKGKLVIDPDVNPFNIDVDVQQGVVTLTGRVKTEEARAAAERHARETDGVREVRNQIQVGDQNEG